MITKQKKPLGIVVVTTVLLAHSLAHAQDSPCVALLTHGIYDTVRFSSEEMVHRRVYDYVCRASRESIMSNDTGGIDIGFATFPIGARMHFSSAKEYFEQQCSESEDTLLAPRHTE